MSLRYTNNAQSKLREAASSTDTEIVVDFGDGAIFPDIEATDNDWFPLTLIKADGSGYEIVRANARDVDTITVERGQENTPTSLEFVAGDIVSLRMTSAAYDTMLRDGVETVTVLKGINAGVHINALNDPYEISVANVTELVDGLRIAFRPQVTNLRLPQIQVNDTEPKYVRIPFGRDSLMDADVLDTQLWYEFHYSEDYDRWILDTPINLAAAFAGSISDGTVEMPLNLDTEAVFDTETEPASFSGAPVVFSRRGISKIIENYADTRVQGLSNVWTSNTQGGFDINVTTTKTTYEEGGYWRGYKNFNLSVGEQLRGANVNVIRASESITLAGTVLVGPMYKSRWPMGHYGPASAPYDITTEDHFSQYDTQSQERAMGPRDLYLQADIFNAIRAEVPLEMLHGGHGAGPLHEREDEPVQNMYPRGRGSVIMFAPKITLTSSFKAYLPVRLADGFPADHLTETDGKYPLSEEQIPPARTSPGGGGMLFLVTEDLTYSPSAKAKLGNPYDDYLKFSEQETASGYHPALESYLGAQCGSILHLNPVTQVLKLIV